MYPPIPGHSIRPNPRINRLLAQSDGIIIGVASLALEPAAISALTTLVAPKPVVPLGPMLPPTFWEVKRTVRDEDRVFVDFLDGMQVQFAKGSVILVSHNFNI